MSHRAKVFVDQWIDNNVEADSFVEDDTGDPRPKELVTRVLSAAARQNIPRNEVEEAFPNLEKRMREAINAAAFAGGAGFGGDD
jgi:hypothetical protein